MCLYGEFGRAESCKRKMKCDQVLVEEVNKYTTHKKLGISGFSGEIYGKCKKFTLQRYYIMKVGHLSRSMPW